MQIGAFISLLTVSLQIWCACADLSAVLPRFHEVLLCPCSLFCVFLIKNMLFLPLSHCSTLSPGISTSIYIFGRFSHCTFFFSALNVANKLDDLVDRRGCIYSAVAEENGLRRVRRAETVPDSAAMAAGSWWCCAWSHAGSRDRLQIRELWERDVVPEVCVLRG